MGGWRRVLVTPLDVDTVSVVTRNISRERYMQTLVELEGPRAANESRDTRRQDKEPEAHLARVSAAILFVGAAVLSLLNSLVTQLESVNLSALRVTAAVAFVLAGLVLVAPWRRHYSLVSWLVLATVVSMLVLSDGLDHYSRTSAAVAVYPVFFIVIIAWAGLTQPRGVPAGVALVSVPVLSVILTHGNHSDVAWQCIVVTLPVAALLGEVLAWSTARARSLTQLERHRRLHDPLTGLANRTLLASNLELMLARARRGPGGVAVLYVDLDRFKEVNDSLGHAAGDAVLLEAAERMRVALRESDVIARVGGDEFVAACSEVADADAASNIAERLIAALGFQYTRLHDIPVTASVGIALSSTGTESSEELLQHADAALQRAKQGGRNRYEQYDAALRRDIARRRELEAALALAVERDELRVFFQPIVEAATARIDGVEALVRWERPGYGLVPPNDFIPAAEASGLIGPIGEWVLAQACQQVAEFNRRPDVRQLGVSVNLSVHQVRDMSLVGAVDRALGRSGLAPELLSLELTESTIIDDFDRVEPQLQSLRNRGVNLAIDDFGTGYSSLTYLRRLPINILKIDGSFVSSIGTEREDTAVVHAVISLARSLNLKVVAEGVETNEQLAVLLQLSCPYLQGFLFSQPRPLTVLVPMLTASRVLLPIASAEGASALQ